MPNDDTFQIHSYQDDLDTDDSKRDPIMDEETDDPTELLQIPPEDFRDELDKRAIDEVDNEDTRETIEDDDENMGQGGKL